MEKSEDLIQQEIWMYYSNKYCLKHHNPRHIIYSVPNGGKRDAREAKKLNNTGLLKGTSDLVIDTGSKIIYCEVKTPKGVQSDDQIDFQHRANSLGRDYIMPRSLDQFIALIEPLITDQ